MLKKHKARRRIRFNLTRFCKSVERRFKNKEPNVIIVEKGLKEYKQ